MARAQHIIDICERRMGGGPVVMFHGTSSVFLRSILKQGFIPDPREKTWSDDPNAGWHRASRASLPGTYFTENVMTAISSSTNTIKKVGGNPIYVVALIQQRSGLVDEDQIVNLIERMREFSNEILLRDLYYDMYGHPEEDEWIRKRRGQGTRQVYAKWLTGLARVLDMPERILDPKITWDMFVAIVRRKAAYLDKVMSPSSVYGANLPDKAQAEREYQVALDAFIKRAKYLAVNYRKGQEPRDTFMHNVRITEPVTYRGSNRILAVYEELSRPYRSGEDRPIQLKIHYGRPIPEFIRDFKSRVGDFEWVR